MAHEAVTRHVAEGRGAHVALRHLGRAGRRDDITFADLDETAGRFANVLEALGIRRGEAVFSLSGRVPGPLLGRARHAEARRGLLSAVLGLRAGADPGTAGDRPWRRAS